MRRLRTLWGLVLLLAIVGCHHTAGVCDCDIGWGCAYNYGGPAVYPAPASGAAVVVPAPAAGIAAPEPIQQMPRTSEAPAPEKAPRPKEAPAPDKAPKIDK